MFIGRITGSIVSTHKVDSMIGQTLFVVEPLRVDEQTKDKLKPTGRTFIVVDTVGVGVGEIVLCVQGSSARYTEQTKKLPIDAAVIGIVDKVSIHESLIYDKSEDE
ncbi:EutN/CcmL family microcompartment protein [Rubinisphaera margarita]|uniref:EutN/CcmL family microcompartment protein n=1 Tax=Rubinisphaera margarita TaxID=2909586 RepID=UPI001EE7B0DB|nr:EutN/CcmL family microcompartment protein [Rubinisphaera margarita]MCG6156839.1 EutN/CcmL family microcompartment protein [Rubinisphaera margarita]